MPEPFQCQAVSQHRHPLHPPSGHDQGPTSHAASLVPSPKHSPPPHSSGRLSLVHLSPTSEAPQSFIPKDKDPCSLASLFPQIFFIHSFTHPGTAECLPCAGYILVKSVLSESADLFPSPQKLLVCVSQSALASHCPRAASHKISCSFRRVSPYLEGPGGSGGGCVLTFRDEAISPIFVCL